MDVSNTFLPVAQGLIDATFPTPIIYRQIGAPAYDPATGDVVAAITDTPIKAGILRRTRAEEGGAAERAELHLWIHHGAGGLPDLPLSGDHVLYQGEDWQVEKIDPTYTAGSLIASKITACSTGGP